MLSDLADASTEAVRAIDGYATELETDALPKARGSFRLGPEVFAEKLRLDEGIDIPLSKLIDIAEREISETQDAFRRTASRIKDGDPLETWQALKADHPAAGKVVAEAREQVQALRAFVEREGFVSVPEHDPIHIGPTPPFCRWTFASIWCPGPFEGKGVRAHYYLTEPESGWTPERQEQHLRDFNRPTLCAISMHEVYPGHYLHFQHLRQINSKIRKSLMTMPMSVVEGWAHYAEHLTIEAGLRSLRPGDQTGAIGRNTGPSGPPRRGDPAPHRGLERRAGRPLLQGGGLPRRGQRPKGSRARHLRSRLWGVRPRKADPAETAAGRRRPSRATASRSRPSTTACWGWAASAIRCSGRRCSAPTRAAFWSSMDRTPCPFTSTSARAENGRRFEVIAKFSDPVLTICPTCGGPVRRLISSSAIQFKGSGFYITDYAKKSRTEAGKESKGSPTSSSSGDSSSSSGDSSSGSSSSTSCEQHAGGACRQHPDRQERLVGTLGGTATRRRPGR